MSKNKLTRREREKIRQRREMLDAALILFSEKGYHNVSMQEIAETSEFAIGTLYKFFQNKEDLYKAMVIDQCDNFQKIFSKALEKEGTVKEKLRNYAATRERVFKENLPFIRLFLAESKGASFNINSTLRNDIRIRYKRFLEKMALIFQDGIEKKIFKTTAPPFSLAVILDHALDAFLLLRLEMPEEAWFETPEQDFHPESSDTILDIFFEGLLNK